MRHPESLSAALPETPAQTGRDDRETVRNRQSRWWRRAWRQLMPPSETAAIRLGQLGQQLAVLEEARTELEAGWVQGGWWTVSSANGGRRLVGGLEVGLEAGPETGLKIGYAAPAATAPAATAPAATAADGKTGRVDGVCLVGALTRAAATGNGEGAGRAVDAVYDALWAARGQPATPATGPATPATGPATPATQPAAPATQSVPPVPSPQVRLARVRTLTQWNDRPERTKAEVLTVVDHAISATILALATTPHPQAAAR